MAGSIKVVAANTTDLVTANVWPLWTIRYTNGSTTSYDPWGNWAVEVSCTTTDGNTLSWFTDQENLVATMQTAATTTANWGNWNHQVQASAEQRAKWKKQQDEARAAEKARAEQRLLANETAEKLLVQQLTEQQRDDLAKKDCFFLESIDPDGKRHKYRIDRGTHGNVKLLDEKNSPVGSFCIQPAGVPVADSMLAQKLWLETNPTEFKRVANFSRWR